jgi:hypothetical protein
MACPVASGCQSPGQSLIAAAGVENKNARFSIGMVGSTSICTSEEAHSNPSKGSPSSTREVEQEDRRHSAPTRGW